MAVTPHGHLKLATRVKVSRRKHPEDQQAGENSVPRQRVASLRVTPTDIANNPMLPFAKAKSAKEKEQAG
jgi:hypothetical protein